MNGSRRLLTAMSCLWLCVGCITLPQTAIYGPARTAKVQFVDAETLKPIAGVSVAGEIGDFPLLSGEASRFHESDQFGMLEIPLQAGEHAIVACHAQGYQRKTIVNSQLLAIANAPSRNGSKGEEAKVRDANVVPVKLMPERGPVILEVPLEYRGVLVVRFCAPSSLTDAPCRSAVHIQVPPNGIVEVKEPGLYVPGHYYPPIKIQRGSYPPRFANDPDRCLRNHEEYLECHRNETLVARFGSLDHPELQTRTDLVARMKDTCVYVLADRRTSARDEVQGMFDFGLHDESPILYRQAYFHPDNIQPGRLNSIDHPKSNTIQQTAN